MIGIYKIEDLIDHKVYIGQSKHIMQRWSHHKCTASNPNDEGYNYPLYQAIRKHGINNFAFSILEECSLDELNNLEIKFIQEFDSLMPNGYNQNTGGQSKRGLVKLSAKQVLEIQNLLLTTQQTQQEIANLYNVHQTTISDINDGYSGYNEELNYPLRHYSIPKKINYCQDCHCIISQGSIRCCECNKKHSRRSDYPSREELKSLIRNYTFAALGRQFEVSDNTIKKWCKSYQLPFLRSIINSISNEDWINI